MTNQTHTKEPKGFKAPPAKRKIDLLKAELRKKENAYYTVIFITTFAVISKFQSPPSKNDEIIELILYGTIKVGAGVIIGIAICFAFEQIFNFIKRKLHPKPKKHHDQDKS